jgi:hypothetical protein
LYLMKSMPNTWHRSSRRSSSKKLSYQDLAENEHAR